MRVLTGDIRIGSLRLRMAHQVQVSSAWAQLTDTCTIVLPRRLTVNNTRIQDYFREGDYVDVRLGYDGDNVARFRGYIRSVSPGPPITLQCEDEMYWLKRATVTKSWLRVTLSELVAYLAGQVPPESKWQGAAQVADIQLGKVRLDRITIAKVLEGLDKNYGLKAWFSARTNVPTLVVGQPYTQQGAATRTLDLQRNVPEQDVSYVRAAATPISIEAINHLPNGNKVTATVGDAGGDKRTLNYYNCPDFRALAAEELSQMRYDGYEGEVVAFGLPVFAHGDRASLLDAQYPDRAGTYSVDAVATEWGVNGYRQKLTLGPQI